MERKTIFDMEDHLPDHILPKPDSQRQKDVSQSLKNLEKNMKQQIETLNIKLSSKLLELEKSQQEQFTKISEISSLLQPEMENNKKISDLISFKKKTTDQMISYDFKFTHLQKDLNNIAYKYDKIYLDNLLIPGTIGDYCRYKNLKDYIEVLSYIIFNKIICWLDKSFVDIIKYIQICIRNYLLYINLCMISNSSTPYN